MRDFSFPLKQKSAQCGILLLHKQIHKFNYFEHVDWSPPKYPTTRVSVVVLSV